MIKNLKILNSENDFEALEDEVQYLSSMKHANIVKFFGWTMLDEKKSIVMEFMPTTLLSGKIIFNIFYIIYLLIKIIFYSDKQ